MMVSVNGLSVGVVSALVGVAVTGSWGAEEVKQLVSEDPNEARQAAADLLAARRGRIDQLRGIIADLDNRSKRRYAVHYAMAVLGKMRALEAIDTLVDHIAFPLVNPGAPAGLPLIVGTKQLGGWNRGMFPAAKALIEIGHPCVPRVFDRLRSTDNVAEQGGCLAVLVALKGGKKGVSKMLKGELSQETRPKRSQRLRSALNLLPRLRGALPAVSRPRPTSFPGWRDLGTEGPVREPSPTQKEKQQ